MTTAGGRRVQDDLVASERDLEQCRLLYCAPEAFMGHRQHVPDSIVDRGLRSHVYKYVCYNYSIS